MIHRSDIQILRGISVLLVVFFHLNIPYFDSGFIGVDSFFVISGFLMALIYKPGHLHNFYRRRASRLLPAYFATVLATLAASTFVTLPSEHAQVVEQTIFASIFASNIGFWGQNSYFSKAEFTPLLHLWSLGVEIQFYIITPILFWLHRKNRFLLLTFVVITIILTFFMIYISPKTAFFMMPFRIWEFAAGGAVAWYLTLEGKPVSPRPLFGLTALILLLAVAIIYPIDGQATEAIFGHPGLAALMVTLCTAGVLTFGLPRVLERSVLGITFQKLGDWSYSIYLAHFPVIVLGLYVPFSGTILTPTDWQQAFVLMVVISVFSAILYILFDRSRIWSFSFTKIGMVTSGVIVLTLISTPFSKLGYNTEQLNILAAFEDRAHYRCGKLFRVLNPTALLCELTGLPDTSPALVLVGDSHADSLKATFAKVAEEQGCRLFFTVSNIPVIGKPRAKELLDQFVSMGIEGVIIHFSSASALRAHHIGFDSAARATGFDSVWVLDVPTYQDSVPAMIWKNPKISFVSPNNRSAIDKLVSKLKELKIPSFDPYPIFCKDGCSIKDEEMRPFYFDNDHLTLTGARELKPMMRSVVNTFGKCGSVN